MSEANIALLRRAWTAYNQGDEEEFAACLTPDWKEYGSPGRDRVWNVGERAPNDA